MIHTMLAALLAFAPQQQTDTTFAVRSNGRLEIDTYGGRITIRSWEREQMRIRARHARGVELELDRSASSVRIDVEGRRGGPGEADLDITVPRSFNIEIDAIASAIDITDVNGDIQAESIHGSITLSGVAGRLSASSVQGRVVVTDSRGDLAAETVNEAIEIRNHTGNLELETVNGGVTMSGIRAGVVNAETVNGSLEYEGEIRSGGRYDMSTHRGSITVVVPEGTNATVSVETYQGEIDADFPIQLRSAAGRERTTFTIGNGGARLQLATFGGSINLRRPGRTR